MRQGHAAAQRFVQSFGGGVALDDRRWQLQAHQRADFCDGLAAGTLPTQTIVADQYLGCSQLGKRNSSLN
jgi:hypothetical protein